MRKITLGLLLFAFGTITSQPLTQSVSQEIMTGNSVACVDFTLGIRANNYFRAFTLSDFGIVTPYNVSAIEFAIEQLATEEPDGLPVTVRIYATTTEVFPANFPAGYTEMGVVVMGMSSQELTVINVPMTATIPANGTIVVAIEIPQTDAAFFQLGSNNLGQTAPSYIQAPTCNIVNPTNLATAGFPDMHSIINVTGEALLGVSQNQQLAISVYPNPVQDILNIEMPAEITAKTLSVTDIAGKQLLEIENPGNAVNISSLSSGIYMLKITTSQGNFNKKIVKI